MIKILSAIILAAFIGAVAYAQNPGLNPGQATMNNSAPVVIASNQSAVAVNATLSNIDPCATAAAKLATPINSSTATQQLVATGVNGKKVYVCALSFIAAAPVNFNLVEGTGSFCQTGTAGIIGSSIATQGMAIATQGGFVMAGALGTVAQSATTGDNVCVYVNPTAQFGGNIVYVQQ